MANEKSRNHDTKGGNGGASKHQGKPKDQTQSGSKASDATTGSGDKARSDAPKDIAR
jgi:hypothetical protein